MTPPDSGEREGDKFVPAVEIPLSLAQRILAALREVGHSGEYARLADEMRERLPR